MARNLQHCSSQGVKICPNVDLAIVSQPHTHTTQEALRQTLAGDREIHLQHTSPSRDVFQKTAALIAALRKQDCPAPRQEETLFDSNKEVAQEARQEYQAKNHQGYVPKVLICDGRLQFSHSFDGQPIIKYVFPSKKKSLSVINCV
jgi:hypothetical protein